jgi:hypothetical protein
MMERGSSKDSLLVCCSSEALYLLLADANFYYDSIKSTQELQLFQRRQQEPTPRYLLPPAWTSFSSAHCP